MNKYEFEDLILFEDKYPPGRYCNDAKKLFPPKTTKIVDDVDFNQIFEYVDKFGKYPKKYHKFKQPKPQKITENMIYSYIRLVKKENTFLRELIFLLFIYEYTDIRQTHLKHLKKGIFDYKSRLISLMDNEKNRMYFLEIYVPVKKILDFHMKYQKKITYELLAKVAKKLQKTSKNNNNYYFAALEYMARHRFNRKEFNEYIPMSLSSLNNNYQRWSRDLYAPKYINEFANELNKMAYGRLDKTA